MSRERTKSPSDYMSQAQAACGCRECGLGNTQWCARVTRIAKLLSVTHNDAYARGHDDGWDEGVCK